MTSAEVYNVGSAPVGLFMCEGKYADTAETVNYFILTYMDVVNVVKLLCRSNTCVVHLVELTRL